MTAMNRLTKLQRHKIMQSVKSSGSKIEIALARALWGCGYKYRKNDKTIYGKPDLTFKKLKIAIFVDSEFWHGKNWKVRKRDHKTNIEFWHKKIERNILRDKEVNKKLLADGWIVLRFWGKEVEKNLPNCIEQVEAAIDEAKRKHHL